MDGGVQKVLALLLITTETPEASKVDFGQLTQLLNIIYGPVVALVSSVVGFYFGARTADTRSTSG